MHCELWSKKIVQESCTHAWNIHVTDPVLFGGVLTGGDHEFTSITQLQPKNLQDRVCGIYPYSPTRSKDNPLQRCSKFTLVPVFYPFAKIYSCVLLPCPPSWSPSLSTILTPVLRKCHLFKTTYATLGACLSTGPIWWDIFLGICTCINA